MSYYSFLISLMWALMGLGLSSAQLSPVILVPGYGGSKLEARWLSEQTKGNSKCNHSTDWSTIWVDYKYATPGRFECQVEAMEMSYNRFCNEVSDKPGLAVRVKEPEKVSSIEYVADLVHPGFNQFATLVSELVDSLGYERDINIRGAPYDFRLAGDDLCEYYATLENMTEQLFEKNNQRITLICHSMGCLNSLYFLQNQRKAWKKKFVRRLITYGAPWGGSLDSPRFISVGKDLYPGMDAKLLGRAARSFPSTYWLFPNERVFGDDPLIVHKPTNCNKTKAAKPQVILTAKDSKKFFRLIDDHRGMRLLKKVKNFLHNLRAPDVETYCIYGYGQPTVSRMELSSLDSNMTAEYHFEEGDKTVSVRSATYCERWKSEQESAVYVDGFKVDHTALVQDPEVLGDLISILHN